MRGWISAACAALALVAGPTFGDENEEAPQATPAARRLSPREEASQSLRDARNCVAMAEQQMAYLRSVEKASGRPAPAEMSFKAGDFLLACRTYLAEAEKRCRAVKC